MAKNRLLIFGINYAPEPTGTALNTTGLAESLHARGWDITVVTGTPHYPDWRRGSVPPGWPDHGVRVLRRRHYVPAAQSAFRRGVYELSWVLSALPTILSRKSVDLILGIVPSLGGAVLAAGAARRCRVPYVLLFQDIIGRAAAQSGISGAKRVAGSVRRTELGLAKRAAGVAIVADGFRTYFTDAGVDPAHILRVRNPARLGVATEKREIVRARLGWRRDQFIVLHSGSMGYKQGLEVLLHAADLARDNSRLHFVLQGEGNQKRMLQDMARRLRLNNVTFLPLAPPGDFPNVLAAGDALMLVQRASVQNMAHPAKLASYFAAGVPVVAAVAPDDETAREVQAARAGVLVKPDDPRLLLDGILNLAHAPDASKRLGLAGKAYAKTHLSEGAAVDGIERFLMRHVPSAQTVVAR